MSHNYSILKIDAISDICKDAGQVFLATTFLEPVVNKTAELPFLLFGIGMMCITWCVGLSVSTK